MDNKTHKNLKAIDLKEVEWDIMNAIRDTYAGEDTLSYEVSIATLALAFKKTNDNESIIDYLEEKLEDETTLRFIEKIEKECSEQIKDISQKYDADTLKAMALFSEPKRFTKVDTHSTPEGISNLAIKVLDIKEEDSVLDLGSGLNSFLIQAGKMGESKSLYGVEINTDSVIVANLRSFIAEESIKVIQGNMISQEFTHLSANKVFSNHPLGMRLTDLNDYINKNPKIKKLFAKSKRTASGDWVYNMAAYLNMKKPGKTVVLMTNAGTWNKPDEELRKYLIEEGIVEGVILLPERLLSTTRIPLTMMVLSQNNKKVKMVDASEMFTEGRRQNSLESPDVTKIVEAYHKDTENSKEVTACEIEEQEYILNPQRYIGIDAGITDGIPLGDVSVNVNRGAMIKSVDLNDLSSTDETNFQYLMLQNIQDGMIDKDLPYLTEIDEKYKKYCIKDNNLVISKLFPFKIAMARVKEEEEILANGNLYFIELDESKVNPVFIQVFLQSEIGMTQLNRYAKGATMRSISIRDLKSIKIPNLPRHKQDLIAEEYENLCDELVILQRQSEIIEDRKSRLLEGVI